MDKGNYSNGYNQDNTEPKLYDELPKEIVDMLMETHPLMGKNEQSDTTLYGRRNAQDSNIQGSNVQSNDTNYVDWSGGNGAPSEETIMGRRTRRYAQEDGDQQYTMRFQTIQSEDMPNDMYQTQTQMLYDNQEGMYHTQRIDFTPQYSPHQQQYDNDYNNQYQQQPEYGNEVSQNTNYNTYQDAYQNSYQEGYQQEQYQQNGYENHEQQAYDMPPQSTERKPPLMQEIEITLPSHNAREEGMDAREGRRNRRNNYDDYDLARGAKQMDLDELYSDDYDDEESISFHPGKKLSIVFSVIVIALIGFLGFRCISLGGKLKEAQQTIAENEDLSARYETLEMDKLKLEEEIRTLKGGETAPTEGENTQQNNDENSSTEASGDDPGNFDWYTVTDSDGTWWGLAQKFYGDGTQYTRILEANGKKESDYVKTGDKLKIPK